MAKSRQAAGGASRTHARVCVTDALAAALRETTTVTEHRHVPIGALVRVRAAADTKAGILAEAA